MLRRDIQRRLYHLTNNLQTRWQAAATASKRSREFLRAMSEGVQIQIVGLGLLFTMVVGTIGYIIIEDYDFVDSLYMTIITLTTVGFGEVRALSHEGRMFTVVLILIGVGLLTYGFSSAIEYVASGQVWDRLERRHKREKLYTMHDHFIIVGFGRVGREVAAVLASEGVPFVVIDQSEEAIAQATDLGYVSLHGTATEDETLREAGIEEARGFVSCAGNDATNVYAVLTARGLNENLLIIARVTEDHSEPKMLRAGADRVISPYALSGRRMANLAIRPHVMEFLDITSQSSELEQALEEVIVEEGSIIVNQTIEQVDLRRRTGANILALHLLSGEWVSNPPATTLLEPGTRLILLGNRDQLAVTEALARSLQTIDDPKIDDKRGD
ncbi:MAG: potassium channel protein [Chloroflexi bacterium]|nr:potassium channel protein [Chloroflexota bacterium]